MDFTIAICTYNGEPRLPQILDCLRAQAVLQSQSGTASEAIAWEILVIDNNSSDQTAHLVQTYQATWPASHPLRYCFEANQGLAFARQRAIQEAQAGLVGFLDDDNLPASTWVTAAYTFAQVHPQAGAYGSRIYGKFEVEPPANFQRIAPLLALIDRGPEARRYEPHQKVLPPGAGLVVRKQAWLDHVPDQLVLQGRIGNSMLAGEDLEALLHLQRAGWEIWYNPAMEIDHHIPPWRLQKEYLLKLGRGIGLSRYRTRMLSVPIWQRPLIFWAYGLNDTRKILLHLAKYRTLIHTDPIAACEMELFVNSLLSPWYFWHNSWQQWRKKSSSFNPVDRQFR